MIDEEQEEIIKQFAIKLLEQQKETDNEIAKIIHENYWELLGD